MKFRAEIEVMPLEEILDPQGKAVLIGLGHLHIQGVSQVRVGRHIRLDIEAASEQEATTQVETACQKLLANPIMESYRFTLAEHP